MKKIFLSSTYIDLKKERGIIKNAIDKWNDVGVLNMENWTPTGSTALDDSLKKVSECDIFICILANRYGDQWDKTGKSITHLEYDYACELFKERKIKELLLYYGSEDLLSSYAHRVKDEEDNKLQELKNDFRKNHTAHSFDNLEHLLLQISNDLYSTLHRLRPDNESELNKKQLIFGENEKEIKKEFDHALNDKIEKIDQFIEKIVIELSSMFGTISHKSSPFLNFIKKHLDEVVPTTVFDIKEGTLTRLNIRHVIIRAETALQLISSINEDTQLKMTGEDIGRSAAKDLLRTTIELKNLIPQSAKAFIMLWDHWDRTGGWGKIEFLNSDDDKHLWTLKTTNNFLAVENESERTHRLCSFWCGYIQGVLNEALPVIRKRMSQLDLEQRKKVSIPPYQIVDNVTHIPDKDYKTDIFVIQFRENSFSKILMGLEILKRYLSNRELFDDEILLICQSLLGNLRDNLASLLFTAKLKSKKYKKILSNFKILSDGTKLSFDLINNLFEILNSYVYELMNSNEFKQ